MSSRAVNEPDIIFIITIFSVREQFVDFFLAFDYSLKPIFKTIPHINFEMFFWNPITNTQLPTSALGAAPSFLFLPRITKTKLLACDNVPVSVNLKTSRIFGSSIFLISSLIRDNPTRALGVNRSATVWFCPTLIREFSNIWDVGYHFASTNGCCDIVMSTSIPSLIFFFTLICRIPYLNRHIILPNCMCYKCRFSIIFEFIQTVNGCF